MLDNCCAFTGHRPYKFPWKYNEADSRCVALKAVLMEQVMRLTEAGMTNFYSGGADGVDCWAALIVLELREKNCQCQCDFVIFRRTGSVRKWRIKVCSL